MIEIQGTVTSITRDGSNNRVATITLDLQPGAVAKASVEVLSADLTLDQRVQINIDNA